MPPPSLAATNAFVAVVEQKSFTRAAKRLGLSPPRVSEMVRNLEQQLGVRLVERTTRSVAVTAVGERLLERLRPVLDDYQAALESTNEFRSKPSGTLRLSVAPAGADLVLADAIPRFLALNPDITVDICVDAAFTDIVAERFDAGIRSGARLQRDMIAVRISGEMPIVVAAAPAYLARRGAPVTPHDVAAHECIRFRLPSGALFPWRFRFKRRSLEVHVQGPLVSNDRTVALAALREGVGLAQVPRAYIAPEIDAGRLVTVLDEWAPPPVDGLFLYYPSRRQIRPALKALVDFLRDARRGSAAGRATGASAQPFPEALWPQSPKPTIAAGQA